MSYRCLIIDDESLGRKRIRRFVNQVPELALCGECAGGTAAVDAILTQAPDLIFLDIQMPDLNGFEVLQMLQDRQHHPMPAVIFVTAYDAFALRAFEVHALDYLLKPIDAPRFEEAVGRFLDQRAHSSAPPASWEAKLEALLNANAASTASPGPAHVQRLEVKSQGRIDYVDVNDTLWLEAEGNYVTLHTEKREHLARITMARLEETLDPSQFLRISRSTIVNLHAVQSLRSLGHRDHVVELQNGRQLPVTRALTDLKKRLPYARQRTDS